MQQQSRAVLLESSIMTRPTATNATLTHSTPNAQSARARIECTDGPVYMHTQHRRKMTPLTQPTVSIRCLRHWE